MSHLRKKILGAGAAMVALSAFVPNPFTIGEALAQQTAQDTMNITAKIVNPLGVNQVTKFNFGEFANSAVAGKYIVNPGAANSISNGVIIAAAVSGVASLTAPQNAPFSISLPDLNGAQLVLKNGTGGTSAKTMKVDQILMKATTKLFLEGATGGSKTFKTTGFKATSVKVTDAGGVGKVTIGGRLNFNPNDLAGTYLGTYDLVITF